MAEVQVMVSLRECGKEGNDEATKSRGICATLPRTSSRTTKNRVSAAAFAICE